MLLKYKKHVLYLGLSTLMVVLFCSRPRYSIVEEKQGGYSNDEARFSQRNKEKEYKENNLPNSNYNDKLPEKPETKNSTKFQGKRKMKRILLWNDFYGSRNFGFCCGRNPFKKAKCQVSDCQTTKSRDENLEDIDAVVFHQRTLNPKYLPKVRYPWQEYVFVSLESPAYGNMPYGDWNNFFNITMTYRSDSDIYMPYGRIKRKPRNEEQGLSLEMVEKKTNLAAWFVSHCSTLSKREVVVQELKKYLPENSIKVYGSCGPLNCEDKAACWNMVGEQFKFYLSLENSICKDYVTEKLFEALKQNVIPVVLGGGNYSALLPSHSYININDFQSVQSLGKYLLYLDAHPEEYLKYFHWKHEYSVLNSKEDLNQYGLQPFCNLCQYLHQGGHSPKTQNIEDWWVRRSYCKHN